MFDFSRDYNTNNVLEEGWYKAHIEKAEYKASQKDNNVEYLNVMFSLDNNKKVFSMYNVFNKNDVARNIAMADLKKILDAQGTDVNLLKKVTKDDLITLLVNGGPIEIAVVIKEDAYGKKNIVKNYRKTEAKEIAKVQEEIKKTDIPF